MRAKNLELYPLELELVTPKLQDFEVLTVNVPMFKSYAVVFNLVTDRYYVHYILHLTM